MFKKNISVLQQRQTSGKDSKQLKRDVQLQFPDLSEDEVKDLLPAKAEVVVLKLSNKSQAYSVDGEVLFFDPEGRGDLLVPTVYTMWKVPNILPAVQTYSEVSPKVLSGADLFLQGFIVPSEGLPHFAAGDLMAVTIRGNDLPFAVGTMETSSEAAKKSGFKGKGVKLLHHYPDQLWQLGEKSKPHSSFTTSRIFPKDDAPAASEPKSSSSTAPSTAEAVGRLTIASEAEPPLAPAASAPEATAAASVQLHSNGAAPAETPANGGANMSQDELIVYCLLAGLQTLSDGDLPMMTSDFYSKHMLPAKPPGATMDIKKSSFKKLSKLLQTYEKKGLLSQKVVHKQDHLSSVNRNSDLYQKAAATATAVREENAAQATAAPAQPVAGNSQSSSKIEVAYCYRFPSSLRPVLGPATTASKDDLFSEAEVRAALTEYTLANSMAVDHGKSVKLDRLLLGNLFNKKEDAMEGSVYDFEDLVSRLLGKLQLFHKICRTSDQGEPISQITKGQVKNISIQTEDRQGGRKHVTKLTHVESFGLNPEELGGILQRKFQTSSSVQKLPGKNETGKEISLQGDLLNELASFLAATYGIDQQYITSISKKKAAK